jgi:hypothetical protein
MLAIQNKRGISYAGAYLRYGFHEDAFTSGMQVAVRHLGGQSPFPLQDSDRPLAPLILAELFNAFEKSIFRKINGFILALNLKIAAFWIGFFVDLEKL